MMDETTVRRMIDRLVRAFVEWLGNRTVEQYYSADEAAQLLGVTERTFHNYADLWVTSAGKDGIGPKHVLSFKVVRYSATSINRFLRARAVTVASPACQETLQAHQGQQHELREAVV